MSGDTIFGQIEKPFLPIGDNFTQFHNDITKQVLTVQTQITTTIESPIPPTTDIGLRGFYQIYGEKLLPQIGYQLSHKHLAYELVKSLEVSDLQEILTNKQVHSNIILECIYFLKQKFLLSDELLKNILSAQAEKIISHTYEEGVIQLEPRVLGESLMFFQGRMMKGIFIGVKQLSSGVFEYYFGNGVYNRFGEKVTEQKQKN